MKLATKDLAERVPAVFASRPSSRMSKRYTQVNTADVIKQLNKEGWEVVEATQKNSPTAAQRRVAKHLIRFRHKSARGIFKGGRKAAGQAYPELVLLNSHDGTCTYRLFAGLHVAACANGLIVAEEVIASISIRHHEANQEALTNAAKEMASRIKPVINRIDRMRKRKLTDKEAKAFARSALKMKFPEGNAPFKPETILTPRRQEDDRSDLWAVFNVIQENLLAGGTKGETTTGRRYTSRPTRDVNVQVKHNQELWTMADALLTAGSRN